MPTIRPGVAVDRNQARNTSRGIISESSDWGAVQAGNIPVANAASGNAVMGLVGLRAGDTVTNCICFLTVVGTSLTFAKLGLFTSTGTFLAATGSVSGTFNVGTGFKVVPLTAPYTITADGGYYVAYLQYGAGATGATLGRSNAQTPSGTQIGTGARLGAQVLNLTDLSANLTPADVNIHYWFAVS